MLANTLEVLVHLRIVLFPLIHLGFLLITFLGSGYIYSRRLLNYQ